MPSSKATTAASSPVAKEEERFRWEESSARLDAVLTVPYSGFYSVAFGHSTKLHCRRKGCKKRKRTNEVTTCTGVSTDAVDNNDDDAIAFLVINKPQDDEATVKDNEQAQETEVCEDTKDKKAQILSQARKMPLPWQEPDGNLQVLQPPSVFLGKVLWIDQHSQLSICMKQQQKQDPSTAAAAAADPREKASDQGDSNDDSDDDDENPLRLHVRLQAVPRCQPLNMTPKKPWACSICGKTFCRALAVSQHQDYAHYNQVNETSSSLSIWTTPLVVVYDDDFLAVVIKPQGMAVQGDKDGQTLQRSSLLMALLPPDRVKRKLAWVQLASEVPAEALHANGSEEKGDKIREEALDSYLGKPRPVHRLDAATGGLLVVGTYFIFQCEEIIPIQCQPLLPH